MQHMPDKDFDNLFRDKFMDAEIEPSADLWGNIAQQLDPKKKRSFPIMWMAAASVVVVASVMLFTQNGDKVYLHHTTTPEVAVVTSGDVMMKSTTVAITEAPNAVSADVLSEEGVSNRRMVRTAVAKVVPAEIEDAQKNNFIAMQPSEKSEHLLIKRGDVKPLDVVADGNVVPIENTATMYAQANTTSVNEADLMDEASENKKGIRNVGDLINYVVDKVDKRDKKLIKFDTDDDDNSTIIGLNIGFLKLNKKNNK